MFSAISESAAASRRKSISTATERRSVSTTSIRRSRRASAERLSACCAAKVKARRSAWKRRSTPGRNTLTATARRPLAVVDLGAMHLRDRGSGDRRTEAFKDRPDRLAERGGDRRFRILLRNGRHLVLKSFQIVGERGADDIRAGREELAELDIARTKARQRGRQSRLGAAAGGPLDEARDAQERTCRWRHGDRIDGAEYAFAREHEAGAAEADEMRGSGDHKRQPECNATIPPVSD